MDEEGTVGVFIASFNKSLYISIEMIRTSNDTATTYNQAFINMETKIKNATVLFCEKGGNQQILNQAFQCKDIDDFITPDLSISSLNRVFLIQN